ncbi:MAG: lipoyl(octanoyl) transferase LipB [bacterium]
MALLIELGRVDYETGLKLQRLVWHKRVQGQIDDTLILLEHHPVITIGRSADKRNLLIPEPELARRGIKIYQVERGGDITYHGPGQLLGYPIFNLRQGLAGVRRFVERIEQVLIKLLKGFGVEAHQEPGLVGVWVGTKKIASIGIAVQQGVSMHGFALNVGADLSGFELINPCGLKATEMTALKKVLRDERPDIPMDEVRKAAVRCFEDEFGLAFQKNLPRSLTLPTNLASSERIISTSFSR